MYLTCTFCKIYKCFIIYLIQFCFFVPICSTNLELWILIHSWISLTHSHCIFNKIHGFLITEICDIHVHVQHGLLEHSVLLQCSNLIISCLFRNQILFLVDDVFIEQQNIWICRYNYFELLKKIWKPKFETESFEWNEIIEIYQYNRNEQNQKIVHYSK